MLIININEILSFIIITLIRYSPYFNVNRVKSYINLEGRGKLVNWWRTLIIMIYWIINPQLPLMVVGFCYFTSIMMHRMIAIISPFSYFSIFCPNYKWKVGVSVFLYNTDNCICIDYSGQLLPQIKTKIIIYNYS